MIRYKALLANSLNLMVKCPNCGKKMGEAYVKNDGIWSKLEKSCYKCVTVLWITFEGNSLHETSYIADALKLEINHKDKKTTLYKREVKYLTINKEYVAVHWEPIHELNEEIEFDVEDLKNIKLKMETMLTFS